MIRRLGAVVALVVLGSSLGPAAGAVTGVVRERFIEGSPCRSDPEPSSCYGDPCEAPGPVDLRELIGSTGGSWRVRFCRPVADADLAGVRVEFHARVDLRSGADYRETPSRVLVIEPAGGGWAWSVEDPDRTQVFATGPATVDGDPGARTGLRASGDDLKAAVAAAGEASGGGLPALALRACSDPWADCGPAYTWSGANVAEAGWPSSGAAGLDHLPDPEHLQLTFPSICQTAEAPTAAPRELVADAEAADALRADGFEVIERLEDGSVRLLGDPDEAEKVVGPHALTPVGVRRPAAIPDDPWFPASGPGAPTGQWSLARVGFPAAWQVSRGEGTRVAVLDTGVDASHPDLDGKVVAARDFVARRTRERGRDLDPTADSDVDRHGTIIASQVAALTGNGSGMASAAPGTELVIGRVFDAEGCASDAAIIAAMQWAVDQGADVLNLSLGGPRDAPLLSRAGDDAVAAGALPVAAAGNTGDGTRSYPAAYDAFVSVAATRYITPDSPDPDRRAGYSTSNAQVELAAPGGDVSSDASRSILGACWAGETAGHGYCRAAGTSFAAPLVAAAAALARSEDPARTVPGLRDLLAQTALDIGQPGRDPGSGHGRIDAARALTELGRRGETLASLGGTDARSVSVTASRATFRTGTARIAVIARDDVFADALAGAPLARDRGPILLTPPDTLASEIRAELLRAVPRGSVVYLLGGSVALSSTVHDQVVALGYQVRRLAGASRIQTAQAIGRALPRPTDTVVLASAANWPDAIAGGAVAAERGAPLLLTWPHDVDPGVSPGVLATLRDLDPGEIVVLGGEAAVARRVVDRLRAEFDGRDVRRVAGSHRWATATAIARDLWGRGSAVAGHRFVLVNGERTDAWAFGLAASPISVRDDAPLLLISDRFAVDEPTTYLRDQLRYRFATPASGTLVGPPTKAATPAADAFARQRVRELLGG